MTRPYVPKPAKSPRLCRRSLPKRALKLAEAGATLYDIALELNCTERTVSRWRLKYPAFREALDIGRAAWDEWYARQAVERQRAYEAYEPQLIKNRRINGLPPRPPTPTASRKAALEITQMVDIAALLDSPIEPPSSPASHHLPLPPPADHANAADEAARRIAERRAARGQLPAEPEEPRGWQDGAGDPVELDDPRSEW